MIKQLEYYNSMPRANQAKLCRVRTSTEYFLRGVHNAVSARIELTEGGKNMEYDIDDMIFGDDDPGPSGR